MALKTMAVILLILIGGAGIGSVVRDPSGSNVAALVGLGLLGAASGAAALWLSLAHRHGWAALAALVSMVTPTGFAYLPNLAMLVFAADEARLHHRRTETDTGRPPPEQDRR